MLKIPLLDNPELSDYAKFYNRFFDVPFESDEPERLVLSAGTDYYNFVSLAKITAQAVGSVGKNFVFNDAASDFYEILRVEVVGDAIRAFWKTAQDDGDVGPCAEFYDACHIYNMTLHDFLQMSFHTASEQIEYLGGRDALRVFEDAMRQTATSCFIKGSQTITPQIWEMRFFYQSASNLFFSLPASPEIFTKVLKPALMRFSAVFES